MNEAAAPGGDYQNVGIRRRLCARSSRVRYRRLPLEIIEEFLLCFQIQSSAIIKNSLR
jgi:hypothetical protein